MAGSSRDLALLLVVSCSLSCASVTPDNEASGAAVPDAVAPSQCSNSSTALPVAALTVEWQEEDTPHSLALRPNGEVLRGRGVVARVVGGCLLDAQGQLLLSVDEKGSVSDKARHRVGGFQKVREQGGASVPPWGKVEALVSQDGSVSAVTDDGSVYYARPGEQAISVPAGVTGPVAQARRTALLLLELRSELSTGHR